MVQLERLEEHERAEGAGAEHQVAAERLVARLDPAHVAAERALEQPDGGDLDAAVGLHRDRGTARHHLADALRQRRRVGELGRVAQLREA